MSTQVTTDIYGLILAGGESKRMGFDKAMINYHGMPQVDYVAELLERFLPEVYVSLHPNRIYDFSHRVLKDTYFDMGPFGGVLTAFQFKSDVAWLTIPVDMPFVDEAIIVELIMHRDCSKMATCFHDPSSGFPEPLLTIWEPHAYPVLLQKLEEGNTSLRRILSSIDATILMPAVPEKLRGVNSAGPLV